MKVISYALWGSSARYQAGAVANVELAAKYYPGWTCMFAMPGSSVGDAIRLRGAGACVWTMPTDYGDYRNLFWRLLPCYDDTIEAVLVRDSDSRPNPREAHAVMEWVQSGAPAHVMRDHPQHGVKIMGGMFGVRPASVSWIMGEMLDHLAGLKPRRTPLGNNWGDDQVFLAAHLWPVIEKNHYAHDDARRITGKEHRFKKVLPLGMFVGQRFDEKHNPEWPK